MNLTSSLPVWEMFELLKNQVLTAAKKKNKTLKTCAENCHYRLYGSLIWKVAVDVIQLTARHRKQVEQIV